MPTPPGRRQADQRDSAATVTQIGDEFEIEATALADQRELGMTWSPLGITRMPAKHIVGGRLVHP